MSRFGELLKEARKRTKLTQQELGKKVPVDGSYISKMETGVESPPSREVAVRIADALGISDKMRRFFFFLAANVAGDEDMEGLKLSVVAGEESLGGLQPAITGTGALGSGVSIDAILPRFRTGRQQTETTPQQSDQNIGLLVEQTVDEAQLIPEQRILAEHLILENARSVCHVLAKKRDSAEEMSLGHL
jgi:transcriptional regulator with XRE-family HTH domain